MTETRVLLAPLEGVTDRTFRSCFYKHFPGLSASLTPFLPIPDRVKRVPPGNLDQVCPPGESPVSEIPQLLVSDPDAFLIAAGALEKKGFTELNWNLGCPSKGVIRKGKGAGLLPDTSHILSFLDKVLPRTSLKVSLKLRLGLVSGNDALRLIPSLRDYPLSGIILHPRLGTQMYNGTVDLDGFEKVMELYGKPICFNGDIRTVSDFRILKERFPAVKDWMIGRGLLADPFLLEDILNFRNSDDQKESAWVYHPLERQEFRIFLDDLIEDMKKNFSRENALLNYLKGILSYTMMMPGIPGNHWNDLKKMGKTEDWKELKDSLYTFLDNQK